MLTEHPDIEKRLRQEILDKVGATESPTYDQMRDMKYTRAFLNGKAVFVFTFKNFPAYSPCGQRFSGSILLSLSITGMVMRNVEVLIFVPFN